MLNGKFKFFLCINISIILGYTFIYFKIFVRHCYKQKVDLYICLHKIIIWKARECHNKITQPTQRIRVGL